MALWMRFSRWKRFLSAAPLLRKATLLTTTLGNFSTESANTLTGFFSTLPVKQCESSTCATARASTYGRARSELKRLVTVLLQEIDDWPATGLLLAATNHPDLLDPAVWRRFEMKIDFPMPDADLIKRAITIFIGSNAALLQSQRRAHAPECA
jgi:SpoVK/Ycf46/Vps4 family AAA+-type ATPase